MVEIEAADLPIVHFTVDLWTCKVSRSEYLGIHIFWVDKVFAFHHALLSVTSSQSSAFASYSRVLFIQVLELASVGGLREKEYAEIKPKCQIGVFGVIRI